VAEESPTPTPDPVKKAVKTASSPAVEAAVEEVAEAVVRSKSPLLTVAVTLLTGGGVAFGGWTTSTALTNQVGALTAKLDKISEELTETRKEIAAAATRAQTERHEERIRALEAKDREQERILDKVSFELDAIKKASPK